ncbi:MULTISPECIES: ABC transporter transmembrane domain-containing protein [unclassified Sinorhizobium]|uniref:ABC transporter transmembrane domain-containing protein n=1 Tax=unclassified Sinorhizobium TaxID=2613772 RepID=UPI0024C21646|nr:MULTISPECIES: ABC transporter transmembrane domain-containing protein [unclassified Sinorhizobium]MDK1374195.1 ABC transporter transmembrane domain-containing protein [Sinorhizobium sp. 6-70]MDK1480417.1 ABC transporter transmembrane domain-containing protein [Sinorhizobium sp. 6-117]
METRLSRYIWTHTRKQQLWILLVVALSMVPYFLSFDLPKQIVNGPIQGEGFEGPEATQAFLPISFSLPGFGEVNLFSGFQLEREGMLLALSLVFLLLVIINGLFKFYINTYKGRLGERLLRRIRFELVDRVLRFPPSHFKRVKPAEISTMIKDEVEPLGGFTGDAFVQPALLGGQALTALIFILLQSLWLGLVAAFIVAIQAVIIPRMRRRLLVLGRERQLTARELSGRVSEIVDGIGTIRGHDTSNYERADIAARLGRIFKIRYDLYQWKFLVKFLNNFLAQVTPFLFYSIGGYFALQGRLDIGQLVAVIGAYKDLPGPLKELIDWDQARQDVQVKYAQVVDQFSVEPLIDPSVQAIAVTSVAPITGALAAVNLSVSDDGGSKVVEHVSLQVHPGEAIAITGGSTGGGEALAEAFGRLTWPETGRIVVGDDDIHDLPESVVGRRISYASSEVYIFHGSLGDNLLYGLKHAPLTEVVYEGDKAAHRRWELLEAKLAGNPSLDVNSDWIDYGAAGATGPDDLFAKVREVLDTALLTNDIMALAVRSTINPAQHEAFAGEIVDMRGALRRRLEAEKLSDLVVFFEPGSYNVEATVGENLLFGTVTNQARWEKALESHPFFKTVLKRAGLHENFYEMGLEIAGNVVELFRDLPPDHPFFQQLTFMAAEEIPTYEALLQKVRGRAIDDVSEDDAIKIIRLCFGYIEPRHRFGLLSEELMAQIVEARREFSEGLPEDLVGIIEHYQPNRYIASASIIDNVLFGRIGHRHTDGSERIRAIVRDLFESLGLYNNVLAFGLDFDVGAGGKRLTAGQRQKLNLARALIRMSDFYIFNQPLLALDQRAQEQITRNVFAFLRQDDRKPAIVWVLANPALSELFDRQAHFENGHLVSDEAVETAAKDSDYKELAS